MCGIVGFIDSMTQSSNETLMATAGRMASAIAHRGPDHQEVWSDQSQGISLGHRRLSIIDLSPEGHQPMHSHCGRYVIVFNGEIYNFRAICTELEGSGFKFRGHSDTEVMLAAISEWGIEKSLEQFNGMFAFALWDRKENRLFLARDRFGEKPLYYGWVGKSFVFGSELKALVAHPGFRGQVDRGSLALFMQYNNVPAPYSIYEGIFKLPPACLLQVEPKLPQVKLDPKPFWSAQAAVEEGIRNPFATSEKDVLAELEKLLKESTQLRMIADVPLGTFLSGGVDSSLITALMQNQSTSPIKTFTIGFDDSAYDEAEHAKAVARHLGTSHTELYVTPQDAMNVIPALPVMYDEPFGDSSQIPTFLVSKLARQYVTVSLSGDGGDELFGGYNRYLAGAAIWNKVSWLPLGVRRLIGSGITGLSPRTWDGVFEGFKRVLPRGTVPVMAGYKMHKLADAMKASGSEQMYQKLASFWEHPEEVVRDANCPRTIVTDAKRWMKTGSFIEKMMFLDAVTYMPNDILTKVDRAAMAVSLESRIPLLDHRIFEFAWKMPMEMKIRNGVGKWALRQILYKYVPPKLIERPKVGFGLPLDRWMRGPLREWCESLLNERSLEQGGFFNAKPIRDMWLEHLSGKRDWQYHLWNVLMFQAWNEKRN